MQADAETRSPAAGGGSGRPSAWPWKALDGTWWVVHARPRCEKAVGADLERLGIPHFLPLVRCLRRHGRRTVQVELPLFPSYLFLCGGESERYATLATHRAVQVIPVFNQDRLRRELEQVWRVITSDEPVDLYPGLRRGARCRVVAGPLAGLEGIVLRRRGQWRVYVGVEVLGQSAQLEIDPALLEVIE